MFHLWMGTVRRVKADTFYEFEIFKVAGQKPDVLANCSCRNQGIRDMKAVALGVCLYKIHSFLTDSLIYVNNS